MGPNLTRLLDIGGEPLGPEHPGPDENTLVAAGRLASELQGLLLRKNGFYAFESALHVFPVGQKDGVMDLVRWNAPATWRSAYGGLADQGLFFAEDAFGFQFSIVDGAVYAFDAETGALSHLANSLDGWAKAVLSDHAFQTGYPLAQAWQATNRPLHSGERLFPKYPFVLGGKFEADNLWASNAVHGMRFRGHMAQQIHDLPDGTQVNLVFDPVQQARQADDLQR